MEDAATLDPDPNAPVAWGNILESRVPIPASQTVRAGNRVRLLAAVGAAETVQIGGRGYGDRGMTSNPNHASTEFLLASENWQDRPASPRCRRSPLHDSGSVCGPLGKEKLQNDRNATMSGVFPLCALAVWRVAHLPARENGPWDLIERLRTALGSGIFGRLAGCFYGLSFLVSLLPAIWMSNSPVGSFIQWVVLSAWAFLVERATQWPRNILRATPVSRANLDKVIHGV